MYERDEELDYKNGYLSGRTFGKEGEQGERTKGGRKGGRGRDRMRDCACALTTTTSLFLGFLIDLVTQYTWPHSATSLPATAPFCDQPFSSRPVPRPTGSRALPPPPSFFLALLVWTQHRCRHRHRHRYRVLSSIYVCSLPLPAPTKRHTEGSLARSLIRSLCRSDCVLLLSSSRFLSSSLKYRSREIRKLSCRNVLIWNFPDNIIIIRSLS